MQEKKEKSPEMSDFSFPFSVFRFPLSAFRFLNITKLPSPNRWCTTIPALRSRLATVFTSAPSLKTILAIFFLSAFRFPLSAFLNYFVISPIYSRDIIETFT